MNGCFINLPESTDRREAMAAQLNALGLQSAIARFEATGIEGLPPAGAVSRREHACFRSHAAAIESAPAEGFFLVLEDDAQLSRMLPALLGDAQALARLEGCDLVFLECLPYASAPALLRLWQSLQKHLPRDPSAPRDAIGGIEILDAAGLYNWGATAYLVTPRGRRTLPALLREALAEGPAFAFDMVLNRLIAAGRLQAAVLAPFLATPRIGSEATSTIDDRARVPAFDALGGALRRLFFAGPLEDIEARAAPYRHAPLAGSDAQLQLLADLMAQLFIVTARAPR
jgi:GR25 family glycosyltransferase involved in LPS biosynthesis